MAGLILGMAKKVFTRSVVTRKSREGRFSAEVQKSFRWAAIGIAALLVLGSASNFQLASFALPSLSPDFRDMQLPDTTPAQPLSGKQKQDILKSNFEKMKHDADDLEALAKSLQEDLNKSNENVLSLKIVEKAEKIEKLARKIKSTARGD